MNPTSPSGKVMSNEEYKKHQEILDKPWADCTTDEKLEKVREELLQLGHFGYSMSNLQMEIYRLKEHDHKDGKIMLPLNANALNGIGAATPANGLMGSRRNNLA